MDEFDGFGNVFSTEDDDLYIEMMNSEVILASIPESADLGT